MKPYHLVVSTVVAATVLGVHAGVSAQDQPAMPDTSPAAQVQKFKHLIGTWEGSGKLFKKPGSEASPWTAKAIIRKALGGHFIREDVVVDLGEAATGTLIFRSYFGFNKETKRFMILGASNAGEVEANVIDWADKDTFVYTSTENLEGQVIHDRWIVKTTADTYSILCKRSIGAGEEFTHVEGSYKRSENKIKAVALKASASFLPPPKPMTRASKMAGVYKLKGSMVPMPGAPEMAISGVETATPIFGGSVIAFEIAGDPVQGMPAYEAFSAMAWNNTKNCYSMIYVSNMGECGEASSWYVNDTTMVTTNAGIRNGQPMVERSILTLDKNGAFTSIKSHSITAGADPALTFKGTYVKQ